MNQWRSIEVDYTSKELRLSQKTFFLSGPSHLTAVGSCHLQEALPSDWILENCRFVAIKSSWRALLSQWHPDRFAKQERYVMNKVAYWPFWERSQGISPNPTSLAIKSQEMDWNSGVSDCCAVQESLNTRRAYVEMHNWRSHTRRISSKTHFRQQPTGLVHWSLQSCLVANTFVGLRGLARRTLVGRMKQIVFLYTPQDKAIVRISDVTKADTEVSTTWGRLRSRKTKPEIICVYPVRNRY